MTTLVLKAFELNIIKQERRDVFKSFNLEDITNNPITALSITAKLCQIDEEMNKIIKK